MSWFEEWFDSPLYELLYAYRNEEEAKKLADLIEEKIPKDKCPTILDVGCGRGRHSLTLAQRGYSVTGIDLSPQAIKKAKGLAMERGIDNVSFLVQDMREPIDARFDAALNLFTTFGYFIDDSENMKVLQSVSTMLEPDGLFMIDFLNARKVKDDLVAKDTGSHNGIEYTVKRHIDNGCVYKHIRFSGETLDKPREYNERVKLYGPGWFRTAMESNGFSIRHFFGDYDGSAFSEKESPRLIILAEKVGK